MPDLDAIRARHEPYADTRVGQDIAAMLSELERLASELAAAPEAARRWAAIREAVATVHAATGLAGDAPLTDDTVAELLTNALQNASHAHYAETALRTDAKASAKTLEHHRRLFVGQQARAERAELALAAAQAEIARVRPVVEWCKENDWEDADIGRFSLAISDAGWSIEIKGRSDMYELIDRGPETGEPGKAACFAAYLRACGLSAP